MVNLSQPAITLHRARGVDYARALDWQFATAAGVCAARAPSAHAGEALAVIEHTPVYTLGRRGGREHVLADAAELRARGAELVTTDRGGDVTFHGPGQLVAYPILDLRSRRLGAAAYVRALEQCVIDTLAAFDVPGERVHGRPGVWVSSVRPEPVHGSSRARWVAPLSKIAAVGVRIERGISRHGLALNVTTDLSWFEAIVPCGIADADVTSMARELGLPPAFEAVARAFADAFERVFDARLVDVVDSPLGRAAAMAPA